MIRVRLAPDSVNAFARYAASSGSAELEYIHSELERVRGDGAVEDEFARALDSVWGVEDGHHRIDGDVGVTLLGLIKHLRAARLTAALVLRIDAIVPVSEAALGVHLHQIAAGEALACIDSPHARSEAQRLASSYPIESVRSSIARQLTLQACIY